MSAFEPTIGKWNDLENYDIEESSWRQVLNLADKYRNTCDVRKIMSWIVEREIETDYRLNYVASTEKSNSLEEYVINVFKETNVPNEIIGEFIKR